MKKKAIIIGAGQIGRGFIGQVLFESGYDLVFVDVSKEIVANINRAKEYKVIVLGSTAKEFTIGPARAYTPDDPKAAEEMGTADIVTTTVGPSIVARTAGFIAAGIAERICQGTTTPMAVIACENMDFASSYLYESVKPLLTPEQARFCADHVDFPDCEVSRMAMPSDDPDPLTLKVEEYIEWMVDSNGLKTNLTDIAGLELTDNPTAYIKRKIYTLTGHAMLGYLGYAKGYKVIYEAAFDRKIFHTVFTALTECGLGWSQEYGIPANDFNEYVAIMLRRFSDTRFNDQIVRICREPIRKLADGERFIGPAQLALKYGVKPTGIIEGLKAAIAYDYAEDEQAVNVQALLAEKGVEGVLREICGLEPADKLYQLILEAYS